MERRDDARRGDVLADLEVVAHATVARSGLGRQLKHELHLSRIALDLEDDFHADLVPIDLGQHAGVACPHHCAFGVHEISEHGDAMIDAQMINGGGHRFAVWDVPGSMRLRHLRSE